MPILQTNPIKAALEYMRLGRYAEAAEVLRQDYDQSPRTREHIARIANLITPCGMISEAIAALQLIDGGIEAYHATPLVDEDIGCTVPINQQPPCVA